MTQVPAGYSLFLTGGDRSTNNDGHLNELLPESAPVQKPGPGKKWYGLQMYLEHKSRVHFARIPFAVGALRLRCSPGLSRIRTSWPRRSSQTGFTVNAGMQGEATFGTSLTLLYFGSRKLFVRGCVTSPTRAGVGYKLEDTLTLHRLRKASSKK